MLSRLFLTVILAGIAAIGAGFAASLSQYSVVQLQDQRIVVEQEKQGVLLISLNIDGPSRLIDVHYTGSAPLEMSVPDHWDRLEVRGGPIGSMTADADGLGYTQWTIPPGMGARFATHRPWESLFLEQLTSFPLQLELQRIHLAENTSSKDVLLLMNEHVIIDPPEGN